MNPTTNVAVLGYEAIASGRIEQLKTMMDAVIAAELQFMVPILRSLLVIFVVRQFTLTWTGNMTVERFVGSSVRAAIIVFLISNSGTFAQRVRDPVFDKIPQAISSTILSAAGVQTTATTPLAQQFDRVSVGADAVTAAIVARSTSWSVASFVNYATASVYNTGIQFLLAVIVAIWLLGQSLLAIILCFGPLLLVFELFERTRGWVDQWIGKLVGLTCFGIGTSILLSLQMTGLLNILRTLHYNLPQNGAEAITALLRVGCNVLLDAFTMAALPAICAIGSGVAASLAAPSAMLALRAVPAMMPALRGAAGAAGAGRAAARTPTNSVSRT